MVISDKAWERFEPAELCGRAEDTWAVDGDAPLRRVASSPRRRASGSTDLQKARLIRENERLREECARLRAGMSTLDHADLEDSVMEEFRSELTRVQEQIERMEASMTPGDGSQQSQKGQPEHRQAESSVFRRPDARPSSEGSLSAAEFDRLVDVVAGYLWARPKQPQRNLVRDALRARGFGGTVAIKPETERPAEAEAPAAEPPSPSVEPEPAVIPSDTFQGIIVVCASCKKVRDKEGVWSPIEQFLAKNANIALSHSICPDCKRELYPDIRTGDA